MTKHTENEKHLYIYNNRLSHSKAPAISQDVTISSRIATVSHNPHSSACWNKVQYTTSSHNEQQHKVATKGCKAKAIFNTIRTWDMWKLMFAFPTTNVSYRELAFIVLIAEKCYPLAFRVEVDPKLWVLVIFWLVQLQISTNRKSLCIVESKIFKITKVSFLVQATEQTQNMNQ